MPNWTYARIELPVQLEQVFQHVPENFRKNRAEFYYPRDEMEGQTFWGFAFLLGNLVTADDLTGNWCDLFQGHSPAPIELIHETNSIESIRRFRAYYLHQAYNRGHAYLAASVQNIAWNDWSYLLSIEINGPDKNCFYGRISSPSSEIAIENVSEIREFWMDAKSSLDWLDVDIIESSDGYTKITSPRSVCHLGPEFNEHISVVSCNDETDQFKETAFDQLLDLIERRFPPEWINWIQFSQKCAPEDFKETFTSLRQFAPELTVRFCGVYKRGFDILSVVWNVPSGSYYRFPLMT